MSMQIEIHPNCIYVQVPYHQRGIAKMLGAEWNASRKMWKFVNNIYMLRDLVRYFPDLRCNNEFIEYGKGLRARMNRLLQIKRQQDASGDPRLRPYQRVDVQYLKELTAAGVFNEQRTGKTPTILTVCRELDCASVLVVCPASLIHNWEREIGMWVDRQAILLQGTKSKRLRLLQSLQVQGGYGVVSYETLRNDIEDIAKMDFDAVVLDEAHRIRNYKTKQAIAVGKLKAKRRYALTGTPTVRNGTDIFPLLAWLYPETYTSYWGFVKRYFQVYRAVSGEMVIGDYRADTKRELQETIGLLSVQRKRSDAGVMDWLKKPQYLSFPVEMSAKQRKVYDQMLNTFVAEDGEGNAIDTATVLAQLTRLRQICLDPALLGLDAPSAKTEALLEYLEDNREPMLIMSNFTTYLKRLYDILTQEGHRVGMLHGQMSNEAKWQAKTGFQSGQYDILLCNIIAAGVGHTLDRATTVIFTDKAWNPADQQQAEDRAIPVSEERNHAVSIVTFPVLDSVDGKIEEILQQKIDLTEVINTGARDAILQLLGKKKGG